MDPLAHLVANRYLRTAMDEDQDKIRKMIERVEAFIFIEENATKLVHDIKRLSEKYHNDKHLAEAARASERGIAHFHHPVLSLLSQAADALDEALEARTDPDFSGYG
jgi:hypothetical protein